MLCEERDGGTTRQYGPDPALASLSASQAKERGLLMSGTYGPRSSISSASVALQLLLANRLQARMASLGSTLYRLIWKERVTPSGLRICALRASALRTSGNAFTGWVTPTTRDWKDSGADIKPRADGSARFDQLPRQANLAGWPTPQAGAEARGGNNAAGNTNFSRRTEALCGKRIAGHNLRLLDLSPARRKVTGELLIGSSAEMACGGRLNPEHSRWLMGLPPEWAACVPTAMPLSRRSQSSSSGQ